MKNNTVVIIPTTLNSGVLYTVLRALLNNTLSPSSIVVAIDDHSGGKEATADALRAWCAANDSYGIVHTMSSLAHGGVTGAGGTRNVGILGALENGLVESDEDIIIFIGDDCIPDYDMCQNTIIKSVERPGCVIQGRSPFHHSVMSTDFMQWLDMSGISANWNSVLMPDGAPKDKITGFFLTTNVAIPMSIIRAMTSDAAPHRLFPEYPGAAWEDIVLGKRLVTAGFDTYFAPNSVVHHYHKQDPVSFAQRQINEGRNRIPMCIDHPQYANYMLPLGDIQKYINNMPDVTGLVTNMMGLSEYPFISEQVMDDFKYAYWANNMREIALMSAALEIQEAISASPTNILQSFYALKSNTSPMVILSALQALRAGDKEYLEHCATWIYREEGESFGAMFTAGLIYINIGEYLRAHTELTKAVELDTSNPLVGTLLQHITRQLED